MCPHRMNLHTCLDRIEEAASFAVEGEVEETGDRIEGVAVGRSTIEVTAIFAVVLKMVAGVEIEMTETVVIGSMIWILDVRVAMIGGSVGICSEPKWRREILTTKTRHLQSKKYHHRLLRLQHQPLDPFPIATTALAMALVEPANLLLLDLGLSPNGL